MTTTMGQLGLNIPPSIAEYTMGYRADSDPVGRFLAECVEEVKGLNVTSGAMYAGYQKWCTSEDLEPVSHKKFGTALKIDKAVPWEKMGFVYFMNRRLNIDHLKVEDQAGGDGDGTEEPPPHPGPG